MPRAVSRDEQAILLLVGRTGSSFPVPELAQRLGLTPEAAQRACEYLVSRGLLRAAVYAVEAPADTRHHQAASRS